MEFSRLRLSTKLVWVAVSFLIVAIAAIGVTLLEAWKLEGGAAAINEFGSQRMRSYRIAYLVSESARDPALVTRAEIEAEMRRFDDVLAVLKRGDAARPLLLPRDPGIGAGVAAVESQWRQIRPTVAALLDAGDASTRRDGLRALRPVIESFVDRVDRVVLAIERDNARNTDILRSMQIGLLALALAGTVALVYLMFLLVVRPVATLQEGIRRMTAGDLGTRLPVETRDEFGDLAIGFNRMAHRLQEVYATLEERVARKTRSLEEKNRELAALYEVTTLLNEPVPTEALCRGFLRKLMGLLDAPGGAVRLVDPQTRRLHLYVQEGLAEDFAREERCLDMGECLCGEAAQHGASIVQFLSPVAMQNVVFRCQRAGYRTVSVFTIRFHGQILGVFNLYFLAPHTISPQQRRMLETLGRNLGVAIESQRLASRDRELAVFEERNLLAQELHDSIAQSLAYLNLQAQMLDGALKAGRGTEAHDILVQMRSGIQESYEDVRELLTHFRTRAKHEDIEAGIRSALARFEAQTGVATSCAASGTGVPLPPEQQLQVLHIVQEALSNVRKHAGASRVEVEIRREPHYVFRLRDDGRGFDPQAPEDAAQAHVGLRIMQERAQRIGGRLAVRSHPGQGCEVTLALPAATPAAVESAAA